MTMQQPPMRPMNKTEHANKKRRLRRGGRRGSTTDRPGLYLDSIGRSIDVIAARDNPLVAHLMTEDFCWRIAATAWREERPPAWHRSDRARWQAMGAELDAKRQRICELAAELGLVATPST